MSMVTYLFFCIIVAFFSSSLCCKPLKIITSERKIIVQKACVAIVRGHKILSSNSRTQQIFLVNTFLGRVPVP